MVEVLARANNGNGASSNGATSERKSIAQTPLFSKAHMREAERAQSWIDANLRRAKREGIFAIPGELTPVLAELLLSKNHDNRQGSLANLTALVKNIKNGDFELNGETVIISEDGDLNDGQHRCWGVIEAGCSIQTLFAFGAKRTSRTTVDQGSARTVGDYLTMGGVSNGNHHAAVSRLIWLYENVGKITRNPEQQPTKAQINELGLARKDAIHASIKAVPQKMSALAGGLTNLAFCHYLFARFDKDSADKFIRDLVKGGVSGPSHVCRERLHEDRRKQDKRLRPEEKIEMIFHAWNSYRRGRPLRQIKVLGSLPPLER